MSGPPIGPSLTQAHLHSGSRIWPRAESVSVKVVTVVTTASFVELVDSATSLGLSSTVHSPPSAPSAILPAATSPSETAGPPAVPSEATSSTFLLAAAAASRSLHPPAVPSLAVPSPALSPVLPPPETTGPETGEMAAAKTRTGSTETSSSHPSQKPSLTSTRLTTTSPSGISSPRPASNSTSSPSVTVTINASLGAPFEAAESPVNAIISFPSNLISPSPSSTSLSSSSSSSSLSTSASAAPSPDLSPIPTTDLSFSTSTTHLSTSATTLTTENSATTTPATIPFIAIPTTTPFFPSTAAGWVPGPDGDNGPGQEGGPGGATPAAGSPANPGSRNGSIPSSQPSAPPPSGAVAGGVIGGIAGMALIFVLVAVIFRWRKRTGGPLAITGGSLATINRGILDGSGGNGGGSGGGPDGEAATVMTQRPSSRSFSIPAALARLSVGSASRETDSSERGFYKVSGRKLPSVLEAGGDGYTDPHQGTASGALLSPYPSYPPAHLESGGPEGGGGGGGGLPRLALGSPMRPVSGVLMMRPGPARTPITEENPFADPQPARSHDNSSTSRFTETI